MKKSLALLLTTALVLSACGATTTPTSSSTTSSTSGSTNTAPAKKSLKDLLTLGVAQKCTYRFTTGDTDAQGELIVDGKKFRQTTKIIGGNGTMVVSAYSDGEYMYTWNDQSQDSGIKMKLDVDQGAPEAPASGQGSAVNLNEKYEYDCQPATVTAADFAPPANVQFMDLGDVSKLQESLKDIDVQKLQQQFGGGE